MKTGCVSCASGDGQNGGPIWWNTPIVPKEGKGKRKAEEELDDDVKKRLEALKGGAGAGAD